jgi:hypothetical protein
MTFVPATTIEDVLRVAMPSVLPVAVAGPEVASTGAGSPPITAVAATDEGHR